MGRKMFLLVLSLPLLSGQMCGTTNPMSVPTTTPDTSSPVVLGPPSPLPNVSVYHIYALDPTWSEDVSLEWQDTSSGVVSLLIDDPLLFVAKSNYYQTTVISRLKFNLREDFPWPVEKVLLNLYCTNDPSWPRGGVKVQQSLESWDEQHLGLPLPAWRWYANPDKWPESNHWFGMNLTALYRDWLTGVAKNQGIQLWPEEPAFFDNDFNAFVGTDSSDLIHRPRLEIWGVDRGPPKFKFPLGGKYSGDRVSGYQFGAKWESKKCTEKGLSEIPLLHTGTDFRADYFGQIISTIERGRIAYAATDEKQGGYIVVEHHDGGSAKFVSIYEHASLLFDYKVGDLLEKGQWFAQVVPGTVNYGPHLHLGIRWFDFDPSICLRGRLPEKSCLTDFSPDQQEPAFPDYFIDPEKLDWEK